MPVDIEGTWFENPRALLDDYIDRLRSAKPLDTLKDNPIVGADSRYVSDMAKILQELKSKYETEGPAASLDNSKNLELTNLFNKRQQYLRELGGENVLPYSERLQNWAKDSGLGIENLNVQDFGGLQHETISHHVPWLAGFSPDYTTKSILNYKIAPHPASPLNEAFAGTLDRAILTGAPVNLRKELLEDPEGRVGRFYNQQGQYAAAMSDVGRPSYSSRELETDPEADTRSSRLSRYSDASIRSNPFATPAAKEYAIVTPGQSIGPENADLALKLDEASKLVDWKLVKPLRERYENLGRAQAPESVSRDFLPQWVENRPSLLSGAVGYDWRSARNLPVDETNFNRMLNLGQTLNFYGVGDVRNFGGGNQMLFAANPVSGAALGAVKAVKNNPYGAAGGAALTFLNDEVAKAIAKDDYQAAGVAAAKDILGGAAIETGLKASTPILQRVAPGVAARVIPAATGAARYGIPAMVGAGLFMQGRSGSALDTLTNKASTVVPGLKPNPQTDIARRAGQAISNEARYFLNSVLQNKIPYLKGRLF